MRSIDVFCHLMPKKYAELAMNEAPKQSHMFVRALKMQAMSDMEYRLEVMKQFPGYKQIPNIVSPPVELFAGPDKSPKIAAIGNDEIKEITGAHPEYYAGFIAGIPFNNVPASVEEIKRCKAMGARGVQIYTHMNGEPIDDEKFWPIYEICEKLDLPILIHPVGGQMTPEFPSEERSKYELWFLIGWPYQTTVAMCRLAFSGIFEDFPNLKIVTHHVGAMIPMLAGRIENGLKMYGGRTAPELKEALTKTKMKGNPLDTFKKFYADTASFGSASAISLGYTVAFPIGVLVIVIMISLLPKIFRIDMEKEKEAYRQEVKESVSAGKNIPEQPLNFMVLALVVVVGVIIGNITIPLGGFGSFSLGAAGGVLVAALILSYIGKIGPINFRMESKSLGIMYQTTSNPATVTYWRSSPPHTPVRDCTAGAMRTGRGC